MHLSTTKKGTETKLARIEVSSIVSRPPDEFQEDHEAKGALILRAGSGRTRFALRLSRSEAWRLIQAMQESMAESLEQDRRNRSGQCTSAVSLWGPRTVRTDPKQESD